MRVVHRIGRPSNVPQNQQARVDFLEFCTQNGLEFDPKVDVYVAIEETDPRLQQLLNLLAQHGFSPKPPHIKELAEEDLRRYVLHGRNRIYEPVDWEACDYLIFKPTQKTDYDDMLRHDGELRFVGKRVPAWMRTAAFAFSENGPGYIASDRARRTMESAGLRRLSFEPVRWSPSIADPSVWWEIDSEVQLPPVSDTVRLVNAYEQPIRPGDTSGGAMMLRPTDGIWPPEYHYRRSAIESVGPFDIARTFEPYGPRRKQNGLVVSRQFYRICRDNKLNAVWTPVRVDPG